MTTSKVNLISFSQNITQLPRWFNDPFKALIIIPSMLLGMILIAPDQARLSSMLTEMWLEGLQAFDGQFTYRAFSNFCVGLLIVNSFYLMRARTTT